MNLLPIYYRQAVDQGAAWSPLVDSRSNAYFMWRILPFDDVSPLHLSVVFAGIFFLGLFALLPRIVPCSLISRLFFSLTIPALLFCVFGADYVLFESIALVPLFWLSLGNTLQRGFFPWGVYTILDCVGLCLLSNQYCIFLVSLVWFLELFIFQAKYKSSKTILLISTFLIAAIVTLFIPALPVLDYPQNARVVADDGLPGNIRPLISESYPLPVIDRNLIKLEYKSLCLVLLVLSFLSLLFTSGRSRQLSKISFLMAVCLCFDILLDEEWAQIAPLASISRVLPTLFFVPLQNFAGALCIVLLCISLLAAKRYLPLLSVIIVTAIFPVKVDADGNNQERVYASPSLSVLRFFGRDLILQKELLENLEFKAPEGIELFGSEKLNGLERMLDGKEGSRWSPTKGNGQLGSEWLLIRWKNPTLVKALELDPGKFKSDFPRGLKVSYASECQLNQTKESYSKDFKQILEYSNWRGPLKFSLSGLPYFGSQAEVKLYFPSALQVGCLLIEQTGHDEHFDWSIAELKTAQ